MRIRPIHLPFVVLLLALIAGCSPGALLLNAITPSDGYVRSADIPYGEMQRHKLDVYYPGAGDTPAARPVVVFFYGGGWETGKRERYRFVANALTGEGFVAIIPDYRVYPDAVFPDFVFDGARAVRWARDNAARFGGDPDRIVLLGHSAGAHIAALLALDPHYLKSVGMAPRELRGMIGLAGPYDFLPLKSERLKFIFGPPPQHWRSQPINFVDGKNPPMLLMTGDEDRTVLPGNTHRLAAKIRANQGAVTVVEYSDMGHVEIITRLAAPFYGNREVLKRIAAFVREH